jgi:hypothetical protein
MLENLLHDGVIVDPQKVVKAGDIRHFRHVINAARERVRVRDEDQLHREIAEIWTIWKAGSTCVGIRIVVAVL